LEAEEQKLAESAAPTPSPTPRPGLAKKNTRLEFDAEAERLCVDVPVPGKTYDPTLQHQVFDAHEPVKLLKNLQLSTPDTEGINRIEAVYRKLKELKSLRKIGMPDQDLASLDDLEQSHPHFQEVIDLVRNRVVLSRESHRALYIPPILLLGEPGVGKTHFSQALATALRTTVRPLDFASSVSNSVLLGSDKKWANTNIGAVFELLALGEHANPIIVIDELDKAGRDGRNDPMAPLHSLLEPTTSKAVRDISLDFTMDASLVIWVATANHPILIPQSLRSRFREFTIRFPDAAGAIQISLVVAQAAVRASAPDGFEEPAYRLAVSLAHLTAREVYQAVTDAVAVAVANGRRSLKHSDFPKSVLLEDDQSGGASNGGSDDWVH
jgi:ATP-dependent Lon protease